MNYFEKNIRWKDFLISFLLLLAMVVVIFSFIGVSEGATNNETINMSSDSKNINESIENLSNIDNKSIIDGNLSKPILGLYGGIRGYNESSNVILEFNVTRANIATMMVCGGSKSYLYLDVSLRYKEDNSPLSNQIVYLIIGNETTSFITNENGIIHYLYSPNIFGLVTFGAVFNESNILDNGSFIDLEPVSVYGDYYISEPYPYYPHIIPSPNIIQYTPDPESNSDLFSPKDLSINKSNYGSNFPKVGDKSGNNSQVVYGKMKETSVPSLPLIVFLIAILGIFGFKRNNN